MKAPSPRWLLVLLGGLAGALAVGLYSLTEIQVRPASGARGAEALLRVAAGLLVGLGLAGIGSLRLKGEALEKAVRGLVVAVVALAVGVVAALGGA